MIVIRLHFLPRKLKILIFGNNFTNGGQHITNLPETLKSLRFGRCFTNGGQPITNLKTLTYT